VFTTLDLPADKPENDHCGTCRACLDACPTNAFPQPYRIDARRCISYLTIEHKGPIDRELRSLIGNRIYGCDDCLAACPWNRFARAAPVAELRARPELSSVGLVALSELDDGAFRKLFAQTAVKRVGRDRFVRNVLIALGNVGGDGAVEAVKARLEDASPLIRGAAVWAYAQLASREAFRAARERLAPQETDETVVGEWTAGAD
jgi:epoxyqueuosine reductase